MFEAMCGIGGILPRTPLPGDVAVAMLTRLLPRGPNDYGWAVLRDGGRTELGREWTDDHVDRPTLFHRRLSILDLTKAGWQPMSTADGRYTIVYNGEVYNHVELRAELEGLGHTFHSHTDTEVVLEAYAAWGAKALERFVGMFAFAVLDRDRRELFLARDFFGIKPLYWCHTDAGFAFASDLPSLLEVPWVPRVADPQTVYTYLTTDGGRTGAGAFSFLRDVRQLPAAHHMAVPLDGGPPSAPVRFWSGRPDVRSDVAYEQAVAEVRRLFLDNVRMHLRSDVPVGAALSGGIDSTAIVCAMRRFGGDVARLHTFSYIASDASISEERWVDRAAADARVQVHKVTPTAEEFERELGDLVRAQGEPFGSTSIYAQYRVFREAHDAGVRVLLDGQGADEMLAGYRHFYPVRVAGLLRSGRWIRAFRSWRAFSARPGVRARTLGAESLVAASPRLVRRLLRHTGRADRRLRPPWLDTSWFRARGAKADQPLRRPLRGVLRNDLHNALVERSLPPLLRYEDRNSMAWSIESRVPFLTPDLVQYVLSLPEHYLIGPDGTTKLVFRDAMRGIVPDEILDRKDKIGFVTTEGDWMRDAGPWVEATLSRADHRFPFLRGDEILAVWRSFRDGKTSYDPALWRILNLVLWAEAFDVRFE